MLRQSIWQDMRLAERGLTVSPAGPSLNLFPDGTTFLLDDELDRTVEETRRFSARDARRLAAFESGLGELAAAIGPLFDATPPDPAAMHPRDLLGMGRLGGRALRYRRSLLEVGYLFATSVSQYLDEWFESDHLKASLGWHAINDSVAGPGTPGTAYVLLHDHAAEDAGGGIRRWGFVPGGIGEVTRMMADAAREAGAEIRTEAPVARVLADGGAATGVELESGEVIEAATRALERRSQAHVPDAVRRGRPARAVPRRGRCLPLQRHQHQDQPGGRPAARGGRDERQRRRAGLPARDHGDHLHPGRHGPGPGRGAGGPARRSPAHRDVHPHGARPVAGARAATTSSPSMSTASPTTWPREAWDDLKDAAADRAIAHLDELFPGLSSSIVHRQVLSPLDLERVLGLTGGHALHGDMAADQLFTMRPVRGWASYRTPIRGLYLCGAGTHPGGGVTGANGRNAAREVLRDRRTARLRRGRR